MSHPDLENARVETIKVELDPEVAGQIGAALQGVADSCEGMTVYDALAEIYIDALKKAASQQMTLEEVQEYFPVEHDA